MELDIWTFQSDTLDYVDDDNIATLRQELQKSIQGFGTSSERGIPHICPYSCNYFM